MPLARIPECSRKPKRAKKGCQTLSKAIKCYQKLGIFLPCGSGKKYKQCCGK
ncbi:MAG: SEC-C domain-containing protein [Bacilli bacterium]|nr:SEC-C domain-containing protein [Bacilli bacterium]